MKKSIQTDRDFYELIGYGLVKGYKVHVTLKSKMWLKRLCINDHRGKNITFDMLSYHDVDIEIRQLTLTSHSSSDYRYLCIAHDRKPWTWPIQAFKRNSLRFIDYNGKSITI